jgi:hypothetical protein
MSHSKRPKSAFFSDGREEWTAQIDSKGMSTYIYKLVVGPLSHTQGPTSLHTTHGP